MRYSKKMIYIFLIGFIIVLFPILIIKMFIFALEFIFSCQEKTFYSDRSNFITEEAIVDYICYDQQYDVIYFTLSEIDEMYQSKYFVVNDKNVDILLENNVINKISIGDEITYTSSPKYFGDGYNMPIVAISIEEEVLLSFEEGYKNLMDSYDVIF